MKTKYLLLACLLYSSVSLFSQATQAEIENSIKVFVEFDDNTGTPYTAGQTTAITTDNIGDVTSTANGVWSLHSGITAKGNGAATKGDALYASYIRIASANSNLIEANASYSISAWINTNGQTFTGFDPFMSLGNDGTPILDLEWRESANLITFRDYNNTNNIDWSEELTLEGSEWHHYLLSYNATENKFFLYIDSEEVLTIDNGTNNTSAFSRVDLLRDHANEGVSVDQFLIFDAAYTPDDINNINIVTSIPNKEVIATEGLGIYPNPVDNDLLTLKNVLEGTPIAITSLSGELISVLNYNGNSVDLSALEVGVYIVSILDESSQSVFTEKLVIAQ